jgi:hypothetical protein
MFWPGMNLLVSDPSLLEITNSVDKNQTAQAKNERPIGHVLAIGIQGDGHANDISRRGRHGDR